MVDYGLLICFYNAIYLNLFFILFQCNRLLMFLYVLSQESVSKGPGPWYEQTPVPRSDLPRGVPLTRRIQGILRNWWQQDTLPSNELHSHDSSGTHRRLASLPVSLKVMDSGRKEEKYFEATILKPEDKYNLLQRFSCSEK